MDEFEIVARFFSPLGMARADVHLGIGDDAAILAPPSGTRLAVTVDTLVAGVHFRAAIDAGDLGYRAAAVNLSDLAAMGAQARYATLALTLPEADAEWLARFARGLASALQPAGVALVGGDTTRGPLSVTLQLIGVLEAAALTRSAARAGDVVMVSGTLGDARAGLDVLCDEVAGGDADARHLLYRYLRPVPRLALGRALAGIAHAAIDVSDGLLADLGHIASASAVAIDIDVDAVPLSEALVRRCGGETARRFALGGGDDYELAVCVPAAARAAAVAAAARAGERLCVIGSVRAGRGVRCRDAAGREVEVLRTGYRHF